MTMHFRRDIVAPYYADADSLGLCRRFEIFRDVHGGPRRGWIATIDLGLSAFNMHTNRAGIEAIRDACNAALAYDDCDEQLVTFTGTTGSAEKGRP